MDDTFWKDFAIPFQVEDDEVSFANPVRVQRSFLEAVSELAYYGEKAERLTEQIAKLEAQRDAIRAGLRRLRREFLASEYSRITKTASSDIQEAFILNVAIQKGRDGELKEIEQTLEQKEEQLRALVPKLRKVEARMKALQRREEWAREYLNFEKLMTRLSGGAF
jgi:uncharacterized coiled-coil protein SlyX